MKISHTRLVSTSRTAFEAGRAQPQLTSERRKQNQNILSDGRSIYGRLLYFFKILEESVVLHDTSSHGTGRL